MHPRRSAVLIAALLLLAACSSSGSETADTTAPPDASGDATPAEGATGDEADVDLPSFASDFDRVCTTQVGFAGATPLSGEPGPHPVILFEEQDSGTLITSSTELPAGWAVEEDDDFDDNSELAATELIACSQITETTPTGVSCDLEGDDGEVITLELVDVSYELTVHEATTGELVGTEAIEAADTDCPTFVFIDEGQSEYFNSPDEDQYINALKPYVDA